MCFGQFYLCLGLMSKRQPVWKHQKQFLEWPLGSDSKSESTPTEAPIKYPGLQQE